MKVREIIGGKQGKETAMIWKQQRELLHKSMDEVLDKNDNEFKIHRLNADTKQMWTCWSKAVEQ